MPHGLPGVETRMPTTLTALLEQHGVAGCTPGAALLQRFVELFAAAPARINRLPGKGVITAGADADIVIFDPTRARPVCGQDLHMGTDFSPFDGRTLYGWPDVVVASGRIVLDEGKFHDHGPVGRLLTQTGFHEGR
jgi:dihydropyrimidinase